MTQEGPWTPPVTGSATPTTKEAPPPESAPAPQPAAGQEADEPTALLATQPTAAPAPAVPAPTSPAAPPHSASGGHTAITEAVVEKFLHRIVALCLTRTPGAHGLHPPSADQAANEAITVRLDGDRAELELTIEVEFGYPVHDVVDQIRTGVAGQAEHLLGLRVTSIDVIVADVVFTTDRG